MGAFGFDKDLSFSKAEFRAQGEDDRPPSTGWAYVKEDDKGKDWPDMKITALGTINYTSKVVEDEKGVRFENGLLCQQSEKEKWIFINESDGRICDLRRDCQSEWDERSCLGSYFKGAESLVITGGGKRTNGVFRLVNISGEPSYYLGEGSYLSRANIWLISTGDSLSSTLAVFENSKSSQSVPDFDWKEAVEDGQIKTSLVVSSVPVEYNKLVEDKGNILEDRVVCEDFRELWWVTILKDDTRRCDLKCDCQNCQDETSCPLFGNLTQAELMKRKDRYSGMVGVIVDQYKVEKEQLMEEGGVAGKELGWVSTLTSSKTFLVSGSTQDWMDGVYVSLGSGSKAAFRMMTHTDKEKQYPHLYKVTEDQWVLGYDTDGSLKSARAAFRAFGEGEEPAFDGWRYVNDDSFEGEAEGEERLDMTVTSVETTDHTWECHNHSRRHGQPWQLAD